MHNNISDEVFFRRKKTISLAPTQLPWDTLRLTLRINYDRHVNPFGICPICGKRAGQIYPFIEIIDLYQLKYTADYF